MTSVSFCPLNECPSPLSRYPVLLLSRNTLYHPWTSPFLLHLENPPISDHMLSPRFLLTHIAGRASLIFQLALSRVHLYLLCTCIFLHRAPPPSFLPLFLRALLPIPTLTEPPTLTAPPSHRLITLVHDPDMHASFPLRILSQHILSLYLATSTFTLRRGSICSLLDMPVSTLYSLRFSPSVPLSRSYLISVLIDCWVLTTYIYLYLNLISFSYLYFYFCLCSLSLFPVPCPCPCLCFVLFTSLFYCRSHSCRCRKTEKNYPRPEPARVHLSLISEVDLQTYPFVLSSLSQ